MILIITSTSLYIMMLFKLCMHILTYNEIPCIRFTLFLPWSFPIHIFFLMHLLHSHIGTFISRSLITRQIHSFFYSVTLIHQFVFTHPTPRLPVFFVSIIYLLDFVGRRFLRNSSKRTDKVNFMCCLNRSYVLVESRLKLLTKICKIIYSSETWK